MAESVFSSKAAVLRWLGENGWQIGKSQFYDLCRDGLLRPQKSGKNKGKYTVAAVEKFATINCRRAETGQKETDKEMQIREEMLELDRESKRMRNERDRFDMEKAQGKYILRTEFDRAVVARAVAFMAHLNHAIQKNVQDWIDLVHGDQSTAPELVEAISLELEKRMGDFAADAEFEVILELNR